MAISDTCESRSRSKLVVEADNCCIDARSRGASDAGVDVIGDKSAAADHHLDPVVTQQHARRHSREHSRSLTVITEVAGASLQGYLRESPSSSPSNPRTSARNSGRSAPLVAGAPSSSLHRQEGSWRSLAREDFQDTVFCTYRSLAAGDGTPTQLVSPQPPMNLDAGRFERPPVVRGVGRPATASNFTLDHPQGEPNRPSRLVLKKTHQVGWPKANFVQTGRRDLLPVAGFNIPSWRPAYSCDPQIISHEEHPPLPPRPQTPRSAVMQANAAYIREVEAQVQVDGVIGDVARVAAIKACFGVQESPRRPPTAPGQMLVGKPRQERPSTAGSVATTTAASASQQQIPTPRLHSARGVHSRA